MDIVQFRVRNTQFKYPYGIDENYSYKWLHSFDNEEDIIKVIGCINLTLPDWKSAPTLSDVKLRLENNSILTLQYYKESIVGWFWGARHYTTDFINFNKQLPTKNSIYMGGAFVCKQNNIPKNAGFQLYQYCIGEYLKNYEWGYAYVDSWNKPAIRINYPLGGVNYNFI